MSCRICGGEGCECERLAAEAAGLTKGIEKKFSGTPRGEMSSLLILQQTALTGLLSTQGSPIMEDPDLQEFPLLDKTVRREERAYARVSYWGAIRWKAAGEAIFQLSSELTDALIHTDLKGIRGDELQLPYKALRLEIPLGFLAASHLITGVHQADAVLVAEGVRYDGSRLLLLSVQCRTNTRSKNGSDDFGIYFGIPIPRGKALINVPETEETSVIKEDEEPLRSRRLGSRGGFFIEGEATTRDGFIGALVPLVLNALLYISMPGADVERANQPQIDKLRRRLKGKKARKTEKARLQRLQAYKTFLVGHHEKLGSLRGEGGKISHQFLVRGHFRNQAHGPGHTLHKRIWIKPHLKGMELEKRKRSAYVVGR